MCTHILITANKLSRSSPISGNDRLSRRVQPHSVGAVGQPHPQVRLLLFPLRRQSPRARAWCRVSWPSTSSPPTISAAHCWGAPLPIREHRPHRRPPLPTPVPPPRPRCSSTRCLSLWRKESASRVRADRKTSQRAQADADGETTDSERGWCVSLSSAGAQ